MTRTRLWTTMALVPLMTLAACGEPPEVDEQSQAILRTPVGGGGGTVTSLPHNICADLPTGTLFNAANDTNLWGSYRGIIERFESGTMTGYLGIDPINRQVAWYRVSYLPEDDYAALYGEANSCKFRLPGNPQIQASTGPLPHQGGNGPGEWQGQFWHLDPVADCPMLQSALQDAINEYQNTCCAAPTQTFCRVLDL